MVLSPGKDQGEKVQDAKKTNKKWIQKAAKKMKSKGTEGSFTRYCKSKGYGGVTAACISEGLKAGGVTAKRAAFAKAMRGKKK